MNNNKRIIFSLIIMSLLFFSLMAYLTYFEFFQKDNILANSYNQRLYEYEESVVRGNIYDRNGTLLAYSEGEGENQKRIYPHNNLYSHIIGYSTRTYGKILLEAKYNNELLGINELKVVVDLKNEITGQKTKGNDVYLTIDHELQSLAEKLLKGKSGSVVAMNPTTGEVLAMVSKPDYNPNEDKLKENWSQLVESEESPFLPRATQGLYVPGSTFKVAIASSAIENGLGDETFDDKGTIVIDGKEIRNFGGKEFGTIDMKDALAYSSNTAFAQIGVSLGEQNLRNLSAGLGFNKSIGFGIPLKQSSFDYKKMNKTDMAAVGMGQGKLLVTPLHMAMITSSIANRGMMVEPLLVQKVTGITGNHMIKNNPTVLYQTMNEQTSSQINEMMQQVVNKGTGTKAKIAGIEVAGKTGTAENELSNGDNSKEHAWFIGFAPAENPQIAVSVIIEYSGSTGGEVAAPIAQQIMRQWIK
ncbi:peptidoglycan glycosyltransferase [Alkalibaculum sp. M08DMB]|uniref:Peptidoglycan glycosyltransferase n=1 Tax=Alkalibaculum sporogenes TaxID=2655001 RepID=A0A6A7K6T6_9FIRM|nr:penicillin-binding transpeptidase domain-containing protein [Alkalibaculum sporogenes]MPW25146.1 peptidoglycan glycosyltransferase [Alkalibaculum sporogenes]